MKLNIICNYASQYAGNFIASMLSFARNTDFEVLFSFPKEAQSRNWINWIRSFGFNVIFFEKNNGKEFKEIKQQCKSKAVDIAYFHFFSDIKILKSFYNCKNIKTIIHMHSDFSAGRKNKIRECYKNTVHKIYSKRFTYIFVSSAMCDAYKVKNKQYIPNALCLDRFSDPDSLNYIEDVKSKLNLKNTIFMMFAWSPYIKGLDVAIKAFNKLENKNNKLLVVHGRDNGLSKDLEYLKSNGIEPSENVIFIHPVEDVFELFKVSDCFISSSRSEGFSYSILEALYFNNFVISSNISGTKWCQKYNNVASFVNEDANDLFCKINDISKRKKIMKVNTKIQKDYNLSDWIEKIYSVLK